MCRPDLTYTLAAGSVLFDDMPDNLRLRLPHYPVPVAQLGRLATCLSARGQQLGAILLFDALQRAAQIADQMGIAAVEVRAKGERARNFYVKYGFQSLLDDPLHTYLPIATVRKLIA